MRFYLNIFSKLLKKEILNKRNFILTSGTYLFILLLYFYLVESASAPREAFLYIVATQAIVSSFASCAFEMNNDIASNKFEILNILPVNYAAQQIIKSTCASLCKYSPIFIILAFISRKNLCYFSITHFLSCLLYNGIANLIGLLSYFIKNIKQLFYINLTLTFALGGLFIPTNNHLGFLKKIGEYTPYPYILSAPAKIFAYNETLSFTIVSKYILWILGVAFLTNFVYNIISKER